MRIRVPKVRITRPGGSPPLEAARLTRGGACLKICVYCGGEFHPGNHSDRITCSNECANKQRVKKSIKPEYWWINQSGYQEGNVWVNGKRIRVKRHRWIMENHLGRKLSRWENVHHIDGNRLNNDISNLELIDHVEHALLHNRERKETHGWNPTLREIERIKNRSIERRMRRENNQ